MRLPFEVSLHRSPRLAGALAALHGAAIFSLLFAAQANGSISLALLAIPIVASGIHQARRFWRDPGCRLRVISGGRFDLSENGSDWRGHVLRSGVIPLPGVIVLRLSPEGGGSVRALVVCADQLDAEDFRRLRQIVRWPPASRANDAPA